MVQFIKHAPDRPHRKLAIIPQVWDAGSALAAAMADAQILGVSVRDVASSLGHDDARSPREPVLTMLETIVRHTQLPLHVDLFNGWEALPHLVEWVRDVAALHPLGITIDDVGEEAEFLRSFAEIRRLAPKLFLEVRLATEAWAMDIGHKAMLRETAIRWMMRDGLDPKDASRPPEGRDSLIAQYVERVEEDGRTNPYIVLIPAPTSEETAAELLRRAKIYRACGANGVMAPTNTKLEVLRRLVGEGGVPVSVTQGEHEIDLADLAEIGVQRVVYRGLRDRMMRQAKEVLHGWLGTVDDNPWDEYS